MATTQAYACWEELSLITQKKVIRDDHFDSAQNRNRTSDTGIFSPLLYQLSYLGKYLRDIDTTGNPELREKDLNLRPPGYEPDELPDCSIPR